MTDEQDCVDSVNKNICENIDRIDSGERQLEELWNILFQVKKVPHSADVDTDSTTDTGPSTSIVSCAMTLQTHCEKWGDSPLLLDRFGPSGFKPLHYLCSVGGPDFCSVADVLLRFSIKQWGARWEGLLLGRGTASGEPPLLLAVSGGHVGAVRWLLARGVGNVREVDRFGRSPLGEARKKAKLPYPFDHYKVILQLLESHIDFSDDVALAQACRDEGNVLFRDEKQFKRAAIKYTESLKLAHDHRTFSNRSQCYLNIAREHRKAESNFQYQNKGKDFYRDLFERALSDAEAARAMAPLQLKHYHRVALALLGLGATHRALEAMHEGLQRCSMAERTGSNAEHMRHMMADILEKLQLTEQELSERYGGHQNYSRGHLPRSAAEQTVVSAPVALEEEVPSNMCMWCETLLPMTTLNVPKALPTSSVSSPGAERGSSCEDTEQQSSTTFPIADTASTTLSGSAHPEEGSGDFCPLCCCNLRDKMSPQLLRDRYLGGNTTTTSAGGQYTLT